MHIRHIGGNEQAVGESKGLCATPKPKPNNFNEALMKLLRNDSLGRILTADMIIWGQRKQKQDNFRIYGKGCV